MSTKQPLPLGHKIPHVFPLPPCAHLPLPPHPLERIAEALLCLEVHADFLRAEAFRMLTEEGRNPLAHGPTVALQGLARPWLLFKGLCISNVSVRIGDG